MGPNCYKGLKETSICLLIFNYMCVLCLWGQCMWAQAHGCQKEVSDPLKLKLQEMWAIWCGCWELNSGLWRGTCALDCWAISPGPDWKYPKLLGEIKFRVTIKYFIHKVCIKIMDFIIHLKNSTYFLKPCQQIPILTNGKISSLPHNYTMITNPILREMLHDF